MKTIVVTGGAGFIGSHLVRHLFRAYPHYHLIVVDALTYAGDLRNLPRSLTRSSRFAFYRGNVCDADLMDSLVGAADAVVHLAAETHVARSLMDSRPFFETAIRGTQALLQAVVKHRRVKRFVFVSTADVYGPAQTATVNEDHPLNPTNPYATAKWEAERLVFACWETHQIPAVVVRPFNNYGPRQHLEKGIPHFVTSCLLGEPLTVQGDGFATRDWLFVADHCDALDRILHVAPDQVIGRAFNLGSGRHFSVLEVLRAIQDALGVWQLPLQFLQDRPSQSRHHACDFTLANQLLGWVPRTEFAAGIERTVAWYRDHEWWWRPLVTHRHPPGLRTAG